MRLLANYTQCTVIGIDYTLSPEARFPQAIEEIVAACCHFHQQAGDYQINIPALALPVILQAQCWRLPALCGYVTNKLIAEKLPLFCCGMGFTVYKIP